MDALQAFNEWAYRHRLTYAFLSLSFFGLIGAWIAPYLVATFGGDASGSYGPAAVVVAAGYAAAGWVIGWRPAARPQRTAPPQEARDWYGSAASTPSGASAAIVAMVDGPRVREVAGRGRACAG